MRQDVGVDGDAQRISQLCWMFFLKILDDQDFELELLDSHYQSPVPSHLQWRSWAADPEGATGDTLLHFVNDELFPGLKGLAPTGPSSHRMRVVRDVFEDAYNYMKSGHLLRQVLNRINEVDFNNLAEKQHFGDVYEQLLNDLQAAGNAGEYYTPRAVTSFMADRIDPKPGEILLDPACGTGGFLTSAIAHMRDRYVRKPDDEELMQSGLRAVEKKPLPHMLCTTNMLLHGIQDPSFVRHDNTLARPYISWSQDERVDIVLTNPPFGGKEEPGVESNFPKHYQTQETADLFLALILRLLKADGRAAVVLPCAPISSGVRLRVLQDLLEQCNLHTVVQLPNSAFRPYASIGTNILFFEKGRPTTETWFYEHHVPEGQRAYSMTRPILLTHLQPCIDWWGGTERLGRTPSDRAWLVPIDQMREPAFNILDARNPSRGTTIHQTGASLLGQLSDSERERDRHVAAIRSALYDLMHPGEAAVRIDDWTPLLSGAGDAVLLSNFVLDLSIRGRLNVPEAPVVPMVMREPWPLPEAWDVSTVAQLAAEGGLFCDGDWVETKDQDPKGDVRLTQLADIGKGVFRDRSSRFLTSDAAARLRCTYLEAGDILIARMPDPIGRACIFPGLPTPAVTAVDVAILRVRDPRVNPQWVVYCMNSPSFLSQVEQCVSGATRQRISRGNLGRLAIPLPPRDVQDRLVTAITALVEECRQLHDALSAVEAARATALAAFFNESLAELEELPSTVAV